jgi:hypothetical protein
LPRIRQIKNLHQSRQDEANARAAATLSMTERDAAMASVIEIEPPAITDEKFVAALTGLLAHLRRLK